MATTLETLTRFTQPATIAMIGASTAAQKAGGRRWLSALKARTNARLYPVHPTETTMSGHAAYRSVSDIPVPIDLAVVMVPEQHVPAVIEECAQAKVGAVVVVSAGFSETGAAGREAETRLVRTLKSRHIRMLGSNSAGVYSASGGVNTLGWHVPAGRIGLITQSGNMALTFTRYARTKQAGFSSIFAVGNGADLTISELVDMLLADDQTHVILIYCEGFAPGDGRRLVDVLQAATLHKPVVLLKPGGSEAGKKAAQSHTGSLAGDDAVADAALRDAGIIRALETETAFDIALALATRKVLATPRIAVLSDGGGHATVVADCAGRNGLELATLSASTLARLERIMPVRSGITNPVDFAGLAESQPDSIERVMAVCLDDPNVDGVIFAGHFGGYYLMTDDAPTQAAISTIERQTAAAIGELSRKSAKPIIMHSEHAEAGLATLRPLYDSGIPLYAELESAAKSMAALHRAAPADNHSAAKDSAAIDVALAGRQTSAALVLLEHQSRKRLADAGVGMPEYWLANSARQAGDIMAARNTPVAMKLSSGLANHKSDIGGVLLDVATADQASAGFEKLQSISRRLGDPDAQVLMTPMISKGVECFIGAKIDPQFGPAIFFGAGGVLVEVMKDVVCRLAPLTASQAADLVRRSKAARLLAGYRGRSAANVDALAVLIKQVADFCAAAPDLVELDLNPVIVNAHGAHVADARMVVRR